MALPSYLSELLNVGSQIGAAYIPYEATQGVMEDIQKIGETFVPASEKLGQAAAAKAEFTPFAVKTGTGTTQVGAGGALDLALGAQPQAIQQGLLSQAQAGIGKPTGLGAYTGIESEALKQAQSLLKQSTPTAQTLFSQLQAMQAPEIQRQQQQLAQQLQAQGRGGVQTAMYGGTPEQLAMQKAIQEQQASNVFQAQQLAPQLAAQQQALATGLFGLGSQAGITPAQREAANLANVQAALTTGYVPQQMQLAATTPALSAAQIAASSGLGESEALYRAGLGGLQTQADVQSALAALEGKRATALSQSLSGLFAAGQGQKSVMENLIDKLIEKWS